MERYFSIYGVAYLVLLAFVCFLLFAYPKPELHLLLNSCHTEFQDVFFKFYSTLAEWPLFLLAMVPLAFKLKRVVIFFVVCEISSGLFVQMLKHTVGADRPASVFAHFQYLALPVVEGVHLHHRNSFPSGHASTFFVFFTCCALLLGSYFQSSGRHDWKAWLFSAVAMLLLLLLAALGAYSRIYISQHFLLDVCGGSIIGFATPCLMFFLGKQNTLKPKGE